jgi:hypothetical protein
VINSETPYKLAEIIRDTWPQLYRPMKKMQVTEHNITDWNLNEEEINALISLSKEKMKSCDDDKMCELFYGLLTGKLIIMKNNELNKK